MSESDIQRDSLLWAKRSFVVALASMVIGLLALVYPVVDKYGGVDWAAEHVVELVDAVDDDAEPAAAGADGTGSRSEEEPDDDPGLNVFAWAGLAIQTAAAYLLSWLVDSDMHLWEIVGRFALLWFVVVTVLGGALLTRDEDERNAPSSQSRLWILSAALLGAAFLVIETLALYTHGAQAFVLAPVAVAELVPLWMLGVLVHTALSSDDDAAPFPGADASPGPSVEAPRGDLDLGDRA